MKQWKDHGLEMEQKMTVEEFIRLTEKSYGGTVIRRLRPHYGMDGET